MASSFWNGEFYFNGVHSSVFNVCIVDVNENEILKQISSTYSISLEKETTINGSTSYSETERSSENIVLQLAKNDKTKWTVSDLINVNRWLFTENFCKFQTSDYDNGSLNIIYYLKAVSMKKVLNNNFEGYIEIEFSLFEPYAYIIPNTAYSVTNGGTINIYNYSNLYNRYKPKLKITNLGNTSTVISITNTTLNSNPLRISGLSTNEEVIVDCLMGTVLNSNKVNRFNTLQTYNFTELIGGDNVLTVTGNATVEVICEFPIMI